MLSYISSTQGQRAKIILTICAIFFFILRCRGRQKEIKRECVWLLMCFTKLKLTIDEEFHCIVLLSSQELLIDLNKVEHPEGFSRFQRQKLFSLTKKKKKAVHSYELRYLYLSILRFLRLMYTRNQYTKNTLPESLISEFLSLCTT